MKKKKRITFSVDEEIEAMWKKTSDNLIRQRVFRSRAEIFEILVYFLQRANQDEIMDFKAKSITIIV